MNRFLANNLPWKLVSLVLATILWIFVINTQDPILLKQIDDLPIVIKGSEQLKEKGFILTNEQEIKDMNVKVQFRGPRLEMEELLGNNPKLEIHIDLTSYANTLNPEEASESIERPFLINIVGDKGNLEIQKVEPTTISILLEKEITETIDIQPNIQGTDSTEYIAQDPILKPNQVKITGAKTNVESVQSAIVDVNVNNFSEDVLTYKVPIKLLDAEGNEVTGVRTEPEEVEVILPIGKKKQVPLQAQFKGALPNGYIQSNVIITPESVVVVGKADVIDQLQQIKLEPIALDNMIQSDTFQVDVILPKGVERIDSNDIVVTVEIQKEIPYEFTIDTKQLNLKIIGLPDNYDLYIKQPTLAVKLLGTPENLLGVNAKDIKAIINLKQMGQVIPGTYTIPIHLQIPENLKLVTEEGKPTPTLSVEVEIVDPNEVFDEEDEGTDSGDKEENNGNNENGDINSGDDSTEGNGSEEELGNTNR